MPTQTRWSSIRGSFQFKLFSIFTLLTFLLAVLMCTLYIVNETKRTRRTATHHLKQDAQQLGDAARLALYAQNLDVLRQLALQASHKPQIRAVLISAPDGGVLVDIHTLDPSDPRETISQSVQVYSSQQVDSVESSLSGSRDNTVAMIGSVRLERGTADLTRSIRHIVLFSICCAIVFWLTVTLLSYLVLRRITRSFKALMHGIEVMKNGDFSSRIEIESDDEAGRAAHAVNNLATALQLRNAEIIRLHEEHLDLERKLLNAQKLESLGIMAGGIAHDYNNLLQSILGNMELASRKLPPDSTSQKYINNALLSGNQAANLTNLMLTYVGKGFIEKKMLNLNDLIRLNVEILLKDSSPSVSMELQLSEEQPFILSDEAHIQQVVMNLIINAKEAIGDKPGLIKLTTGIQHCDQTFLTASLLDEKPEPGQFVFLEVNDNGCGMNEETLKRLFDPFFTTKFTGRGLGMSAVMGIIKSNSGALFVESEPGMGTTFKVLFPVVQTPAAATVRHEPAPLPPAQSILTKKPSSPVALVVDDEKSVLKVCTKMVKLCGYTVITACDGADAVAKFREHIDEISIILMDLTMPNMDGITAMAEIYSIRPDSRVILSSGFNEDELSGRITCKAPSGFIRKPYSMNVLETELERVMQGA